MRTMRPQSVPHSIGLRDSGALPTILATLLACLVLLPLLGHKPLTDWDEAIYAEVSREMLSSGWWVPHWNAQLWFEKPPLMLWITAVFFRLFGVAEFWARLGSALSGIAVVALAHHWVARRFGLIAAALSTFLLLSTFGFLHVCRLGEMDVLLSLGCLLALFGLERIDNTQPSGWYLFWSGFAIALMTKGAASALIPLTAIVFAAVQRWKPRFNPHALLASAAFLLCVLPWHLAMLHRFGQPFVGEYLGLHVWSRATSQIEGHNTPWWFYLKVLLVSAPPWVLVYPFAFGASLRTSRTRALGIFALITLAFFTAVQTRLPHYIAPIYAPLSILSAIWLSGKLETWLASNRRTRSRIAAAAAVLAVFAVSILATARPRSSLHSNTLPNGTVLPDNRDATALTRAFFQHSVPVPGDLLVLRAGPAPINTAVFYSHRVVRSLELQPSNDTSRYSGNSTPIASVLTARPQLILLDRSLEPDLPPGATFTPILTNRTAALGTIQLRSSLARMAQR